MSNYQWQKPVIKKLPPIKNPSDQLKLRPLWWLWLFVFIPLTIYLEWPFITAMALILLWSIAQQKN